MYLLYLLIWLSIVLILNILFRTLTPKMKNTDNLQTKNTLFTILLFTSIPLLMTGIIAPIVILAGDEKMPVSYKIFFIIFAILTIITSFGFRKEKS